jgi:hypothetical protein
MNSAMRLCGSGLKSTRARNVPVFRSVLQEHAEMWLKSWGKKQLGHLLDGESFRKRYQIVFNEVCGEASEVCKGIVAEWFATPQVSLRNRTWL